jgi:hypothetical protein
MLGGGTSRPAEANVGDPQLIRRRVVRGSLHEVDRGGQVGYGLEQFLPTVAGARVLGAHDLALEGDPGAIGHLGGDGPPAVGPAESARTARIRSVSDAIQNSRGDVERQPHMKYPDGAIRSSRQHSFAGKPEPAQFRHDRSLSLGGPSSNRIAAFDQFELVSSARIGRASGRGRLGLGVLLPLHRRSARRSPEQTAATERTSSDSRRRNSLSYVLGMPRLSQRGRNQSHVIRPDIDDQIHWISRRGHATPLSGTEALTPG